MFHRLAERGKLDVAYATPLTTYAARQLRAGRQVGAKLNANDITSARCRKLTGVTIRSLDDLDSTDEEWKEVLNDKRATPDQIAICRIDFSAWLRLLGAPLRRIANALATGESTNEAAKRFGVSPGRISQLRRHLKESWDQFQSEHSVAGTGPVAVAG
jgi:hypothetical protein